MAGETNSSTHPPLPPTAEDDRFSWLRLLRSRRVGVSTFWRLMGEHGNAGAALAALPEVARAAGISDYAACPEGVVYAELKAAKRAGAQMLCKGFAGYPSALSDLEDAPPILWSIGDIELLQRPMIAMVGARNASSLGTRMARRMAEDLGQAGFVVVSGLARGVDAAAHLAALPTGTIAVVGGGVDIVYPSENAILTDSIRSQGLILSEQPMGLQPQSRHFPARNRIISGLAQAVLVVEAAAKSGSLITARNALDQGREVLAVPGHPFDARAAGCNMLLRDGAILVRSAEDVIEALGAPPVQRAKRPAQTAELPLPTSGRPQRGLQVMAALHQKILDRLGPSPLAEDQLIRDLGASTAEVATVLVDLELDGQITRAPGGLLSRSH